MKGSYRFAHKLGVFLVRLDEVQEPKRKLGVKKYRSIRNHFLIKMKMIFRIEIPEIKVRRKEKTGTEKLVVYDGFHRYHISKELRYQLIPVSYISESHDEFLVQESIQNETRLNDARK